MADTAPSGTFVVACAALAREITTFLAQVPGPDVEVQYLPAPLHNTPDRIPAAVEAAVAAHPAAHVVVAYADCGTGGRLDAAVERLGAARLPGAHCYELFAGSERFAALMDEEPGTFFLTDFLARHFDALVIGSLGLDDHPELRDVYFARYRRVVLLSQSDDPEVVACGRRAAERLGLEFEHVAVGTGGLHTALQDAIGS